MVRLTKIYTKTGDKGTTSLASNIRISKNSLRIGAIGDLDELNSFLGFSAATFSQYSSLDALKEKIIRIQNELFNLGSQLAVLQEKRRTNTPIIHQKDITKLENEIDEMNKTLPTLASFVLPGGCEIAARLHLARTICRRAERSLIALAKKEKLNGVEIPYLNRLSDWLFVAARYVNTKLNVNEILWQP